MAVIWDGGGIAEGIGIGIGRRSRSHIGGGCKYANMGNASSEMDNNWIELRICYKTSDMAQVDQPISYRPAKARVYGWEFSGT